MMKTANELQQERLELALAKADAALASAGDLAELRSHLRNLEKKISSHSANDTSQVAHIAGLRKELDALKQTIAKSTAANAKRGDGLTQREFNLVDALTSAMAEEAKRHDKESATIRADLRSIAAVFQVQIEHMRQLSANQVVAAAHLLQEDARFFSSSDTPKANGTVPKSLFENLLIGEMQ